MVFIVGGSLLDSSIEELEINFTIMVKIGTDFRVIHAQERSWEIVSEKDEEVSNNHNDNRDNKGNQTTSNDDDDHNELPIPTKDDKGTHIWSIVVVSIVIVVAIVVFLLLKKKRI